MHFSDQQEAADGLEKVASSLDEPQEAAGLEKVAVSSQEPEEAAEGLKKLAITLDEPRESADGLETEEGVSLGEPDAVAGSPEDCKMHSKTC